MRLKVLLILPILSIIGLSLSLQLLSALFVQLLYRLIHHKTITTKKTTTDTTKPLPTSAAEEDPQQTLDQITGQTNGQLDSAGRSEMWKCRKCQKPVYFAERKCSLGYDWHPECLTCQECGKRLNPGQHAEHKGIPYCYIPCYGALFGPQLYGHGSRVESHSSFGQQKSRLSFGTPTDQMLSEKVLETKLKEYNQYYEGKGAAGSHAVQYRERNGHLILEGSVRIYWDVSNVIQLKEDNDDRVFIRRRSYYNPRRRSSATKSVASTMTLDDSLGISSTTSLSPQSMSSQASSPSSPPTNSSSSSGGTTGGTSSPESTLRRSQSIPTRGSDGAKQVREELRRSSKSFDDEYVQQIANSHDRQSLLQTTPNVNTGLPSATTANTTTPGNDSEVVLRRTCNLRRSRVRLKRRCSINGHFYNRETSTFTPAHGSVTSVFISSLLNAPEVINLLLDKFKVTNKSDDFALFVLRDNGECKRLNDSECPLIVRVMLGPNESAAKVFIFNKNKDEISSEVAQYLRLSNAELRMFLRKFEEEEIREINKIKHKYAVLKTWIKLRLKELDITQDITNEITN